MKSDDSWPNHLNKDLVFNREQTAIKLKPTGRIPKERDGLKWFHKVRKKSRRGDVTNMRVLWMGLPEGSQWQTNKNFLLFQTARDVLCDPEKRIKYDKWRASGLTIPFEQWNNVSGSMTTVRAQFCYLWQPSRLVEGRMLYSTFPLYWFGLKLAPNVIWYWLLFVLDKCAFCISNLNFFIQNKLYTVIYMTNCQREIIFINKEIYFKLWNNNSIRFFF